MGIQVETYESAPIGCGTQPDLEEIQSPEAQVLIDQLDLAGQRGLMVEVAAGDDDSVTRVNPYRAMTLEEQRVYRAICPGTATLQRYAASPIPLRVLQVAAHAAPFFKRLEVWHPESAVMEDPVLVGLAQHATRSWEERIYILARWGATLLPFDQLRAQAAGLLVARWRPVIEREIAALAGFRDRLDSEVGGHLAGSTHSPGFSLVLA